VRSYSFESDGNNRDNLRNIDGGHRGPTIDIIDSTIDFMQLYSTFAFWNSKRAHHC